MQGIPGRMAEVHRWLHFARKRRSRRCLGRPPRALVPGRTLANPSERLHCRSDLGRDESCVGPHALSIASKLASSVAPVAREGCLFHIVFGAGPRSRESERSATVGATLVAMGLALTPRARASRASSLLHGFGSDREGCLFHIGRVGGEACSTTWPAQRSACDDGPDARQRRKAHKVTRRFRSAQVIALTEIATHLREQIAR